MSSFGRLRAALDILSTLLVIAVACGLLWTMFLRQKPSVSAAGASRITEVEGVIAAADIVHARGTGQIAVVEFSDFQCPFCAKHAREALPEILNKLADDIRYIVVNLPLDIHPYASRAAEVAECASGEGRYWEMHALLFERQKDLPIADYASYGKELGLDAASFESCLHRNEKLAKIHADKALADRLQVKGTPTLFIGRMRGDGGIELRKRINGSVPVELIQMEVAKLHKNKS